MALTWTAREIKVLRWRLGWSRAELGRVLSIEITRIAHWELGKDQPAGEELLKLLHLMEAAEERAIETRRAPLAERVMKENGTLQISSDQMQEVWKEIEEAFSR